MLLLAGGAALLGTALPAATRQAGVASVPSAAARPGATPEATPTAAPSPTAPATRTAAPTRSGAADQGLLLRPLVPFTGLMIVLCLVLLLQHTRVRRRERRNTWADYAALAAMLGSLFMLGVLGAGAGPGGPLGGAASRAAGLGGGRGVGGAATVVGKPSPDWLAPLLNAGLIFATLFFTVVAVYLYRTLRRGAEEGPADPPTVSASADPARPPLHRVRLAWRRLETALAASGLARRGSETPEEFAARLSLLLPAAAADLHVLTRLYLPVRYGGELSEAQATRAEAAEVSVRQALHTNRPETTADLDPPSPPLSSRTSEAP